LGTERRDRPLAGLVSDDAEALYARLLEAGSLAIGPGPDQVDVESPAARELIDAGIGFRTPLAMNTLRPTTQTTAVRLLLARQHRDITTRQEQAVQGWELLDSLLTATVGAGLASEHQHDGLVKLIHGTDKINRIAYELQQSAQHELLAITTGKYTRPIDDDLHIPLPSGPVISGKYRVIYDTEFASNLSGARLIEISVAAGERARIRARLPLKMLHVDNNVALVALTETGLDGSLLVSSPHLLAALRDWFELLWKDEATAPVHSTVDGDLSAAQRQVLRLLASGLTDEAIARASEMSVRTVRRHITAVMDTLGANSRFAAGVLATKRGWI
jgi:DNA-binding CsgD family transcriptional regulator